ncbi:hypothetical protein ACWEP8_37265 [Streptomyces hydrogenans]
MIDNLGFHTDHDIHAELADIQRQITSLTAQVANAGSYEDRFNAEGRLAGLQARASVLTDEVAAADANHERLATAVTATGNPLLGFLAYVALGPRALPAVPSGRPMEPLHEIRVIERLGGYTVPGTVRRNLTADQVDKAKAEALAEVLKPGGHAHLWGQKATDLDTQVLAY